MSYCNECPNHDACDTGCVLGAARRSPTPGSPEQELADLKEKIRSNVTAASAMLGLPYGMSIEDFCEAVSQLSPSSETREKCGRCGKTDEGGCMEIPCPLGARTSMRELEEQLRQWYVAASPYATPNALKEALASVPSAIGPSRKLRTEVLNAINKLENLGNTFSSTNFTDRYGDGPHCLDLAKRLKEALNGQ